MEARITEVFYSLSGEGQTTGIPTIFIRFAGCSLRCGKDDKRKMWCDTGYSLGFETGELKNLTEILEYIEITNPEAQIILTGGEPLEGEEKRNFCAVLSDRVWNKRHKSKFQSVRLETSGKEDIRNLPYNVFTLDYKLPGSGMEKFMLEENFHFLRKRENPLDEVKFVVRDKVDFDRAIEIIEKFSFENTHLLFSPVKDELEPSLLAEWVKNSKLPDVRLSLQIHKIIWGERRGV
ncbi:MAG: 4Fe-4S cluster-binding domain-containing protein [Leptospiraceae bacterium]|nr:4Fe-4S cluster-binding domain-containing protein [Leptospiraceae bacterium]